MNFEKKKVYTIRYMSYTVGCEGKSLQQISRTQDVMLL